MEAHPRFQLNRSPGCVSSGRADNTTPFPPPQVFSIGIEWGSLQMRLVGRHSAAAIYRLPNIFQPVPALLSQLRIKMSNISISPLPVKPSPCEGRPADAGRNVNRGSTGTEQLIPCPRDQEILTSNWGGSGRLLRIRCNRSSRVTTLSISRLKCVSLRIRRFETSWTGMTAANFLYNVLSRSKVARQLRTSCYE